jgi:isoleucyl-tRNA synthetase
MSTKFKEYKGLNLPKLAEEILDFWNEENIFEKSISIREGAEPFVFFEGPPSANGLPGIHHVMARAIKDIFCRYKTQKGFKVDRKAGWDTHGLPIELGVEKELGITKEDIGKKISVEEYNAACKKSGYALHRCLEQPYRTRWLLGRYGKSVCYLRAKIYGNRLVVAKRNLQQEFNL